jgi:phosphodiesterase/alkaline phosphatase D-like protein
MPRTVLTRRELVAAGATAAAGAAVAVPDAWARSLLRRRARVGPGAFLDGVASGEPGARAVTLWTRLTTGRPRSGARLVVARDAGMRRVVATAVVPTGAGVDGALKARVGGLEPGTEYFYAWESGTSTSPIGRTRTAPAPGSADTVRITSSSCQSYASGHFAAHLDAAARADVDLALFLGDYVYETAVHDVRRDPIVAVDLATYRRKYALYRSDPALRELHRLHPVAHVWDDHEVENNYTDGEPPLAPAQRAASYRAAFEWLPRLTYPSDRHRIFKRLALGGLVDLFLLDERQYRVPSIDGRPGTLLGERQLAWLIDGLQRSQATWKLVAQQLRVVPTRLDREGKADAWDGYPEDRARLLGAIEAAAIPNVVFLTGDEHVFMANLLASDFAALGDGTARRPAAVEYVTGSVTSPGRDVAEARVQQRAPWVRQYHGGTNGYGVLDLAPDRLVTDYVACATNAPVAPAVAFERFVQPAGANAFERQTLAAPPLRR